MKTYEWILFDADETLFHWDAYKGLQRMFTPLGIDFTKKDYKKYLKINKPLWVDYQKGTITSEQLKATRLRTWAAKIEQSPQALEHAFMMTMSELSHPLDGAVSLLDNLKDKTKFGIITNGFTALQQIRLERTGLTNHFELLVISEQVGVAKPHIDIFNHALTKMGNPMRERVLMVGDNPESDIRGGINAGLDTCWLNVDKKRTPKGVKPTYQVTSLTELENLLLSAYAKN